MGSRLSYNALVWTKLDPTPIIVSLLCHGSIAHKKNLCLDVNHENHWSLAMLPKVYLFILWYAHIPTVHLSLDGPQSNYSTMHMYFVGKDNACHGFAKVSWENSPWCCQYRSNSTSSLVSSFLIKIIIISRAGQYWKNWTRFCLARKNCIRKCLSGASPFKFNHFLCSRFGKIKEISDEILCILDVLLGNILQC